MRIARDEEGEPVRRDATWDWLKKVYLKKKTESMILVAQDKALTTNDIRSIMIGEYASLMSRLSGEKRNLWCI